VGFLFLPFLPLETNATTDVLKYYTTFFLFTKTPLKHKHLPHEQANVETAWLTFCSPVQVAYFVNSGSEANDMAILMARLYSGNHDLIALRNGYHGISEGLLGVLGHSTWKYNVPSVST